MVREESELRALEGVCDADSGILRDRVAMAEKLVRDLQEGRWVVPEADKLVVATTVVHGQLYDLVCEDMAIEDAMFVLGRALDKEKVGLDVFLKVSLFVFSSFFPPIFSSPWFSLFYFFSSLFSNLFFFFDNGPPFPIFPI